MQSTARMNQLPLDKMCLVSEVTKKMSKEDFTSYPNPKEGVYIHGLFMEVQFSVKCEIKMIFIKGGSLGCSSRWYIWVKAEGTPPRYASYAYQGSYKRYFGESSFIATTPLFDWTFQLFQDKMDVKNLYECPVYKTRQRGLFINIERPHL